MTENTKPKPFCFVLMPFDEKFKDTYQFGIKEACNENGAYCERVDEQIFQETILERLYNQIAKADFVIADMSERNPNVFYEVGYAHALGKSCILLTQSAADIPFDLKHYAHIVYKNIGHLKTELSTKVKFAVDNVSKGQRSVPLVDIQLFANAKQLYPGESTVIEGHLGHFKFQFSVCNNSVYSFANTPFRIGITGNLGWMTLSLKSVSDIDLPDGSKLFMLPDFYLLPLEWSSYHVAVGTLAGSLDKEIEVIFRVISEYGSYDYSLKIVSPFSTYINEST